MNRDKTFITTFIKRSFIACLQLWSLTIELMDFLSISALSIEANYHHNFDDHADYEKFSKKLFKDRHLSIMP